MDDFTFLIDQALKEGENQKRNKAIAKALRCVIKNEFQYDKRFNRGLDIIKNLEMNLSKWQKDPDSMDKRFHTSLRILEVIKILEEC